MKFPISGPVSGKRGTGPAGEPSGGAPGGPDATRRGPSHRARGADRWALLAVAAVAAAAAGYGFDGRWFEDDAMITMQYARNVAEGCGWSFNCGADDFATTSFLHTFLASIAFHIATEPDTALALVKAYEAAVIALATAAFFHMLVGMGIGRLAAALAAFCLLTNHNTFLYMSSGMENALYLLALSATFGATARNRYVLAGGLTGICHLVRPEAALVGPMAALADLLRRRPGDRAQAGRWMGDWARAGAVSLAVAAPVWMVFLALKGTPVPVSGEIKLLTAANWGPFHDMIRPLIGHEIHWLPFALAGLAAAAYRRSLVLGPIGAAAVLVVLYSAVGLPKSPWYYLPLHFGFFAAAAAGIDLLARAAGRYRSWLAPTCHAAMAVLLASPVIDLPGRFSHTAANIHAVAAKRNDINRRTGEWLRLNAPADAKAAIPNIGYIGFYGDTEIVDIVGLVTPDIARNREEEDYWWDTYRPEIYGDKAVPWHRRFDDPRYELAAVKGRPRHHRERYALWLRSDLATERVRRSWTLSGDQFEGADAAGAASGGDSADGGLRIAIPPDGRPIIKLVAHLDGQALLDEGFPASDLVIDLTHNLPRTPVDSLTIVLRSNSEAGPGYAALRMARGFVPERRQHSVLSQENIFEESNFNPGNLARLELEYAFRKREGAAGNSWLSIEHLEVISFSGCRLSGSCISRLWK